MHAGVVAAANGCRNFCVYGGATLLAAALLLLHGQLVLDPTVTTTPAVSSNNLWRTNQPTTAAQFGQRCALSPNSNNNNKNNVMDWQTSDIM